MTNSDFLEDAFLGLSFAIKLWNYMLNGQIKKEEFDIDLTVVDGKSIVPLLGNQFNTTEDLIIATEHMMSISFGVAANILWECVNEKGVYSAANLSEHLTTQEQKLAGFTYMLRCCFAHGPAIPKWMMCKKYQIQYKVGNKIIDLSQLNNKIFQYEDIGGFDTLWILKSEMHFLNMI